MTSSVQTKGKKYPFQPVMGMGRPLSTESSQEFEAVIAEALADNHEFQIRRIPGILYITAQDIYKLSPEQLSKNNSGKYEERVVMQIENLLGNLCMRGVLDTRTSHSALSLPLSGISVKKSKRKLNKDGEVIIPSRVFAFVDDIEDEINGGNLIENERERILSSVDPDLIVDGPRQNKPKVMLGTIITPKGSDPKYILELKSQLPQRITLQGISGVTIK